MRVLVRTTAIALAGVIFQNWAVAQPRLLMATALSPIVQNARADEDELSRITDSEMLEQFVASGYLVPVPVEGKHYYLKAVPDSYRYIRPWSKSFLDRTGAQFYAKFHERLRVTSLVRTEDFQERLARINGNAAPASGPTQSSHLTGATLDISKAKMSPAQRNWMRNHLVTHAASGYLYAIEERRQPTFHIMVYKNFPGQVQPFPVEDAPMQVEQVQLARVQPERVQLKKVRVKRVHVRRVARVVTATHKQKHKPTHKRRRR